MAAGVRQEHKAEDALLARIARYWSENLHDMAIATHDVGTREFFDELDEYHFDKQRHLERVIDYPSYAGKKLLDVGCGVGIDLMKFARAGAQVTGVDISQRAIELARTYFAYEGLQADLRVMDAEHLEFDGATFDAVYAHGVLPYTGDPQQLVDEVHRVLKPGGSAIFQVYHKRSWMYLLRRLAKFRLEHEGAPVFRIHTASEMGRLVGAFEQSEIIYERFPVKTRLHGGIKGALYNGLMVGGFNTIPRSLVRRFGWHIVAKVIR